MDYESGIASDVDTLKNFAEGIKDGSVWGLQGHYGRTAKAMIDDGWIERNGELTEKALEFIADEEIDSE